MNIIKKSVLALAGASGGNPIMTTIVIFMFYLGFNGLEALVEALIFGHSFKHWLDPLFIGGFIAYSAYAVYGCALFNSRQ